MMFLVLTATTAQPHLMCNTDNDGQSPNIAVTCQDVRDLFRMGIEWELRARDTLAAETLCERTRIALTSTPAAAGSVIGADRGWSTLTLVLVAIGAVIGAGALGIVIGREGSHGTGPPPPH